MLSSPPGARLGLPETAYKRGYRNPSQLRDAIAEAHTTRLWRTTGTAVLDHLSVVVLLLAATSPAVRDAGWWALALALPVAVLLAARQLRALECLVHEASHFNWSRRHRTAGDILATVLAGAPTGARIADYRTSHLLHHGRFGTAEDPDRTRYEELDLENLDRSGVLPYTLGMIRRFGAYQRGWLESMGSAPLTTALPFLWCALVLVLPARLMGGTGWALAAGLGWLATHLVGLPALRFVGEANEHVYREADTVFGGTVSNIGLRQRLLFHPHGDGFHTVHHLWPGVPHHRIARLHRELLAHDEPYRATIRYRTRVLEQPRTGLPQGAV
ncbi:fatty acid desaturase family protein [Streptomyces sp. ATCC51928]|uniref:Fatty acid desaturase family protein n=1 Tax=Streptomyces caviscabies TaxID=90079 RepID=A0ABW2MHP7_9ACTN|nr:MULTISPECIES: fatty acid desaturase family protein [unclassified Streptomyces]MDX3500426.1 fatty acid desaturase family protein [Streptomyces sp. ATCC51928]MDX5520487.1 fatty acid desaturase family protein [Streptomyces sp. DE06-01C]